MVKEFLLCVLSGICVSASGAVGDVSWTFETGDTVFGSPAMDSSGTLYVGSRSGELFAIDSDGSEKWNFLVGDWVDSSPTLSPDEKTVYLGSWDNNLYAVSAESGAKLWEFETGSLIVASPAVDAAGNVFVGSSDGFFYSLDSNGNLRWQYYVGDEMDSSPAVAEDGSVYVGAFDGVMYSFSNDGSLSWEFQTGLEVAEEDRRIKSSPTVSPNGDIYFGAGNGKVYALDPSGVELWNFDLGDKVDTGVAIASDDSLIVGSRNGSIYSIDQNGVLLWESYVGDVFYSTPAVAEDGSIYVGAYLGNGVSSMTALSAGGALLWEVSVFDYIDSSPLIGETGQLVFCSYDGVVYSVEAGVVPAKTGWNRFGGDRTNRSLQNASPTAEAISAGFGNWVQEHGLIGLEAEPGADGDGDGVQLLVEYLAGGDPAQFDEVLLAFELSGQMGAMVGVYDFNRLKVDAAVHLELEQSSGLELWEEAVGTEEILSNDVFGDGKYEAVRFTISVPQLGDYPFARLRGGLVGE